MRVIKYIYTSGALTLSTLLGCASANYTDSLTAESLGSEGFVPATVKSLSEEEKTDITQAIGRLTGKGVKHFPGTAFISDSRLLLTRVIAPTQDHPQGFAVEHLPPDKFELFTNGKTCVLLYSNENTVTPLKNLNCTATES